MPARTVHDDDPHLVGNPLEEIAHFIEQRVVDGVALVRAVERQPRHRPQVSTRSNGPRPVVRDAIAVMFPMPSPARRNECRPLD
jgi:hypothetical protein